MKYPEWMRWLLDDRTPLELLGSRRPALRGRPHGEPPTYYDTLANHRTRK